MATVSRHVMSRLIALQCQADKAKQMDIVSIADSDIDIVEYIAGFVLHRIRQKAYRLQSSVEKTATLELIGGMIRDAEDATSSLIKCQQRGGLLSVISDLLPVFKKFEIMFRQITHQNQITTEIPLQNLVEAAVNDTKLVEIYSVCTNHLSENAVHKKAIYRELAVTYFMVRVNGFCRQTMEKYRQRQNVCRRSKALRKSAKGKLT